MNLRFLPALAGLALLCGCSSKQTGHKYGTYNEVYTNPMSSVGTKFGALPPAVQYTIRAETGAAEILDIIKDSSSGKVVYRVYFRDVGTFPTMYVAPDGSVLYPDLTVARAVPAEPIGAVAGSASTVVKMSELTPEVLKTIQTKAPSSEVAAVNKEAWGNKLVFVITFKDPVHNPPLYLTPDGAMVSSGTK
jgi:hypothetical protein